MRFFSFNLELICTCEFFKKRNCTRRSGSCNFSFSKNSLVQINSKLNSKPYEYLYTLHSTQFNYHYLLYQIMNIWFEIRIYYIKSWTYDLKSRFIISNHKLMIWNKNLLYQINDVWYHITKLYLVNNEKNYKIKLNHFFFTNGAP